MSDPKPTPTNIEVHLGSATDLTRGAATDLTQGSATNLTRESATLPGPAIVPTRKRPSTPPTPLPPRLPTPRPAADTVPQAIATNTLAESEPLTTIVLKDNFVELPPGSVVGDVYEIDAKIGKGAMGEVYAARHVKLGKRVAIKVISNELSEDPDAIARFSQEARALAQIQHPAIVAVDHVGELADGRAYFVMELLRGEPLFSRLQREHLPLTKALRILDQIARGLEAAHAQGIIHRDLKPENIFLVKVPGEPSVPKILDLGLSKLRRDNDRRATRTQSGAAIGTPMYMSPEQMRGPDVDHRTDIYALGCISFELILGRKPFPHVRTAPEAYAAHLNEAPPLPRSIWPEIPPQLDLMLFAMLAKDADHRPTLAQVRSVIASVQAGIGTPSQRAPTEYVSRDSSPQLPMATGSKTTIAIALATLLVGIIFGALMSRRSGSVSISDAAPVAGPSITPIDAPVAATPILEAPPAPTIAAPAVARPRSGSGSVNRAISRPAQPSPKFYGVQGTREVEVAAKPATIVPPDAGVLVDPFVEDARLVPAPAMPSRPSPNNRDQTMNPFAPKRSPSP